MVYKSMGDGTGESPVHNGWKRSKNSLPMARPLNLPAFRQTNV
jgi:hypothetical protein